MKIEKLLHYSVTLFLRGKHYWNNEWCSVRLLLFFGYLFKCEAAEPGDSSDGGAEYNAVCAGSHSGYCKGGDAEHR